MQAPRAQYISRLHRQRVVTISDWSIYVFSTLLKVIIVWLLVSDGLFVLWRSGRLVLKVVWEENIPSRGFPWSLLTPCFC